MNILNRIIDTFEYQKARAIYLQQVISRIGVVEELEECIICYVKQKLLEKNAKSVFYELNCDGMNTVYDKSRELVDYFKLNKPVYYIFDGITFDTVVNISSLFANIIFKNCTFNTSIRIFFADSIVLENNKYNCWTEFKDHGNAFLYGKIKNLIIKNERFINISHYRDLDNNFGINIEAENINIENSTIYAGNKGQISIKAKKLEVLHSKISAPEIFLDSDSIVFGTSLLKAKGVIIETKNCNCDKDLVLHNIDSPYTVYNGTVLIPNGNFEDEELKKKRLMLVNTLKIILKKHDQSI